MQEEEEINHPLLKNHSFMVVNCTFYGPCKPGFCITNIQRCASGRYTTKILNMKMWNIEESRRKWLSDLGLGETSAIKPQMLRWLWKETKSV